jgi:hypothetical protein
MGPATGSLPVEKLCMVIAFLAWPNHKVLALHRPTGRSNATEQNCSKRETCSTPHLYADVAKPIDNGSNEGTNSYSRRSVQPKY